MKEQAETKPSELIRDQILTAAREIFSRYGYRKTTLDDIGKASGRGKTGLYYYFKNKEEIFREVLDREIAMMKEELLSSVRKERTPRAKLRRYIIRRMELFHKLVNIYSAMKEEYTENLPLFEAVREQYDRQEIEIISGILQEGVRKKIFVRVDTALTAYALILAMKGFEYPFSKESDVNKIEKDIDSLLKMLFHGLLATKKK
jgi:AcrR family transcriptional regulator